MGKDNCSDSGKQDQITNICRDGDVILVVGPEKERLRVYSQVLRSASKVFAAMLGPNWSEGQGLSAESPKEIPLVEDNAEAMRIICFVIHLRNDFVPRSLKQKAINQIAILVDKYDLEIALEYATSEWLGPRANSGRVIQGQAMAAAFLLNNTEQFEDSSLTLIFGHGGPFSDFLSDEFTGDILHPGIFWILEERRTAIRLELYQLLIDGEKSGCECGWGQGRSETYRRILAKHNLSDIFAVSIETITGEMEKAPTDDLGWKTCYVPTPHFLQHQALDPGETLTKRLNAMGAKARLSICEAKRLLEKKNYVEGDEDEEEDEEDDEEEENEGRRKRPRVA